MTQSNQLITQKKKWYQYEYSEGDETFFFVLAFYGLLLLFGLYYLALRLLFNNYGI